MMAWAWYTAGSFVFFRFLRHPGALCIPLHTISRAGGGLWEVIIFSEFSLFLWNGRLLYRTGIQFFYMEKRQFFLILHAMNQMEERRRGKERIRRRFLSVASAENRRIPVAINCFGRFSENLWWCLILPHFHIFCGSRKNFPDFFFFGFPKKPCQKRNETV